MDFLAVVAAVREKPAPPDELLVPPDVDVSAVLLHGQTGRVLTERDEVHSVAHLGVLPLAGRLILLHLELGEDVDPHFRTVAGNGEMPQFVAGRSELLALTPDEDLSAAAHERDGLHLRGVHAPVAGGTAEVGRSLAQETVGLVRDFDVDLSVVLSVGEARGVVADGYEVEACASTRVLHAGFPRQLPGLRAQVPAQDFDEDRRTAQLEPEILGLVPHGLHGLVLGPDGHLRLALHEGDPDEEGGRDAAGTGGALERGDQVEVVALLDARARDDHDGGVAFGVYAHRLDVQAGADPDRTRPLPLGQRPGGLAAHVPLPHGDLHLVALRMDLADLDDAPGAVDGLLPAALHAGRALQEAHALEAGGRQRLATGGADLPADGLLVLAAEDVSGGNHHCVAVRARAVRQEVDPRLHLLGRVPHSRGNVPDELLESLRHGGGGEAGETARPIGAGLGRAGRRISIDANDRPRAGGLELEGFGRGGGVERLDSPVDLHLRAAAEERDGLEGVRPELAVAAGAVAEFDQLLEDRRLDQPHAHHDQALVVLEGEAIAAGASPHQVDAVRREEIVLRNVDGGRSLVLPLQDADRDLGAQVLHLPQHGLLLAGPQHVLLASHGDLRLAAHEHDAAELLRVERRAAGGTEQVVDDVLEDAGVQVRTLDDHEPA